MAESETAARFKKAKVTAVQIGKVRAVFDPKWKDVVTKLKAAIKAKQNDKIDLYLAALDGRIKELNKILRAATLARGDLREIELDEDFVAANLQEVEKAVTTVSDAVDGLTEAVRRRQDPAERGRGRVHQVPGRRQPGDDQPVGARRRDGRRQGRALGPVQEAGRDPLARRQGRRVARRQGPGEGAEGACRARHRHRAERCTKGC